MTETDLPVTVETHEICVLSVAPETATLGEVLSGYVNHIGSCIDGAGNVFAVVTQDGPNAGDVDVVIMKRAATTGAWSEAWRFREAQYGKHGYGSAEVLNDGRLCCLLSERNAAGATVLVEYLLTGLAVKPSAPTGGADTPLRTALKEAMAKV
jgi:hypothetical protein